MAYRTINLNEILTHFPEAAHERVEQLFGAHRFRLRITAPRQTRMGSFRPGRHTVHTIQINIDLKPYTFLLIFLHELAHLLVWEQYGKKALAHGAEWKSAYRDLAAPFIADEVFAGELAHELRLYFRNPAATFSRNARLMNILTVHEGGTPSLRVDDVPINQEFTLENGKKFLKIEKLRTRYKCFCPADRKYYLVQGSARVTPGF